ncbi:hypothetical protein NUW58_g2375 [Xylaria curta]|uniref:Uncharacterized protein n=1 Tax=Xylaria curta TaxID=42375 RepID=A0ACC1PFW9_9PEZI|nr:hypothetical protein NUW58_g2375 [Xylaria curta]
MPFIANTPESLIGRTDSKNPSTTCRGITAGGRPCRRPIGAAPGSSPSGSPLASRSRVHQLRVDDPSDPGLYCWQHKDQASSSAKSSPGPGSRTKLSTVRQESFESLIDRLGIVEAERDGRRRRGNLKKPSNGKRNESISHTGDTNTSQASKPKRKTKTQKHESFCWCFKIPVYEKERPSRPKPRPIQNVPTKPNTAKLPSSQHLAPSFASQRPVWVCMGLVGVQSVRFSGTALAPRFGPALPGCCPGAIQVLSGLCTASIQYRYRVQL